MTTIYGIKNCDTMKKARKWMDNHSVEYNFHDVRVDGIDKKMIQAWVKRVGWETLLNTRGMTWRKLSDQDKSNMTETKAINIMLESPAIIKRPVLKVGRKLHIGFKENEYEELLL